MQTSQEKSMANSRVAFKENPKDEGEEVIIFFDEKRDFDKTTEIIFDQHKFERYVPGSGFSMTFWILFHRLPVSEKSKKGQVSNIVLFVRNRFTTEMTVGVKENNLFIELNTPKKEKIYSEQSLENEKWYQVAVVSSLDEDMHEINLYVNGKPDSSATYSNFDPLGSADVQFGKFKGVESFKGSICDASMSFFALTQEEISGLYTQGKKDIKETQMPLTSKSLLAKTQDNFVRTKYSKEKKVPRELMSTLQVDPNVLEEKEVVEEEVKEEEASSLEKLREYFINNPVEEAKWEAVAANFDWIFSVVSVMSLGTIDKTGKIEIPRFQQILFIMHCEVTQEEILNIAKIVNSLEASTSLIYYYDFLKPIKLLLAQTIVDEREMIEEKKVKTEGESEEKKVEEQNEEIKESPEEEVKEEEELVLPELQENWADGYFTIVINRCHDCHLHETYSRHTEDKFVDLFNSIGGEIKKIFPNAEIIGNYEKVSYMEGFDVYIRGVGPANQLDETGRLMLFSKAIEKRLPTPQEIVDKLIILSFTYGNSNKMTETQELFLKQNEKQIPRPYKRMHKYPSPAPVVTKKKSPEKRADIDEVKRICSHWGCGATFINKENGKKVCTYHPGKFEFGSLKGWWPEGWSCCRKSWESLGCTVGTHVGVPVEEQVFLCINHGEIAPGKEYPDSFCGLPFTNKNPGECAIHPGYIKKNQFWSCCNVHVSEATPCQKGEHKCAVYPADEAKIYFYNAPVMNPGLDRKAELDPIQMFKTYGRVSGYFKKSQEYQEKTKVKPALSKEEQDKIDLEDRFCLHWGCEKVYKNKDNFERKPCRFHPGKWDFGHTGVSITEAMEDQKSVLWGPHWTCCRKNWKTKGCQWGEHRGPPLKVYEANPKKFMWPDMRAQVYFRKVISEHWKQFIDKYQIDIKGVETMFHYFASTKGIEGRIPLEMLPMLLDKLKLHLLVLSEDLSFHFKYMMVVKGKIGPTLDDGDGKIDKEKFLDWWKMDLEETLKRMESLGMDQPEEEEPIEEHKD
eukprot:TRINITY_DN5242_c0_g2_i1.p1 TRINITY_DN5242_c0_g2~~TRINITY_DN5242_c0_g2_i1.p1  ORF type:complete len:1020 (+),score=217.71 TRINITY_DN5242_c0_g2_i1:183-3242(+)